MKILAIGDIVGENGLKKVREILPKLRKEEELDENMNISTNNDDKSVLEYVRKLPIKYHSVIYLHYYEGYQVNEIAKMLKTTSGTIKSRLSRARKLLQKNMEGEFNYE